MYSIFMPVDVKSCDSLFYLVLFDSLTLVFVTLNFYSTIVVLSIATLTGNL